jgi:putative two-component system response regulator
MNKIGIIQDYDALTSKRAYKDAYSHEKAVEIITNEIKNYFDPEIVEVFLLEQEQFIVISEGCGSCR